MIDQTKTTDLPDGTDTVIEARQGTDADDDTL